MKRILVLGAGMVAGAHVQYLLAQPDLRVTVASRTVSKAQEVVAGHPRGEAQALDITDRSALETAIASHDLSVSLLPWAYHPVVAALCVKHGKHMVTTSYVKDEMAALDQPARDAGVLLLNEMGVDPGIDHMTAMRVINKVKGQGGRIREFTSWCGGLPAPEANDNPFGYKFSWSPRGVLLAGLNNALYLEEGKQVYVDGRWLFESAVPVGVEIEGRPAELEGYPNRNSLPYMETYGIETVERMFRGTLRNRGFSKIMARVRDLGYLGTDEWHKLTNLTFREFTAWLAHAGRGVGCDVEQAVADRLHVDRDDEAIQAMEWLGLFDDDQLPIDEGGAVDVLTARMLSRMSYKPGERDMLVLQHRFLAEYPDRQERIQSTMIDFGQPEGFSSMNRTVGLPAAIGVRLIMEDRLPLTGVHIPVLPEIYEPVLAELEQLGLDFDEKWSEA